MRELERKAYVPLEESETPSSQTVGAMLDRAFNAERTKAIGHIHPNTKKTLDGLYRLISVANLWGVSEVALPPLKSTSEKTPDAFEEADGEFEESFDEFLGRIRDESGKIPKSRPQIFGEALQGLMLFEELSTNRLAKEVNLSSSTVKKVLRGQGGSPESIGKIVSYLIRGNDESVEREEQEVVAHEVFNASSESSSKQELPSVLGKWVSSIRSSRGQSRKEFEVVSQQTLTSVEKGRKVSPTSLGKVLHATLYPQEKYEEQPNDNSKVVGEFLKRARIANDISRQRMSEMVGISVTRLDSLEKGQILSAEYYGKYIVYLLGGSEAVEEQTKSTMKSRAYGAILRDLRKDNRITLQQLSEMSGFSIEEHSDMEMGEDLDPLKITHVVTLLDAYNTEQSEKNQELEELKKLSNAELITHLRSRASLSQAKLAEAVGITIKTLSKLEADKKSVSKLMKARVLDVFKDNAPAQMLLFEITSEMSLREYMQFLRLRKKLSQQVLGERMSLSREAIEHMEKEILILSVKRTDQYIDILEIEEVFAKLLKQKLQESRNSRTKASKLRAERKTTPDTPGTALRLMRIKLNLLQKDLGAQSTVSRIERDIGEFDMKIWQKLIISLREKGADPESPEMKLLENFVNS